MYAIIPNLVGGWVVWRVVGEKNEGVGDVVRLFFLRFSSKEWDEMNGMFKE